jgi:nitroreductase
MDLLDLFQDRRSTRGFLDTPVDRQTTEQLLHLALQAPSAINIQPWEIMVVSGEERKRLSNLLVKRMRERNISCSPGSTDPLPDVFVQRQRDLMKCMLPGLPENVDFQDFINEGSCHFYGAPTALIITIDQIFSSARLTDMGIMVGYLVLAAHTLGLGTCPIGLITAFDDEIKELLNIPEQKKVVIGIAVGHKDPQAPINKPRSKRAPLNECVKWRE